MVMSNSASISVSASASCANKLIVSAEKAKEEAENFLQTIKEERAKTYKNSPDDLQIVREKSADKAAIMDTTTNKQTASPDLVKVKGLEGSKNEDAHEAKENVTKQLDTEIEQNPMKKLHKMSSELGYQIAPVVGYQATSPVIPVAGIHYMFTPSHIEQSAVATLRSSQFFGCMVCEKRSNTLYDAITHLRGHTGDKPFHCCFCNYVTAHELAIKNHFQLKHASHELPNDKDNEEQTSDKYDETINPPPAGPPAPPSHSSESDDVPPTNSANEDTTEKDPLQPEWPAFFANRRYIDFDFCISEKESKAVATFLKSGSYRCEVCNIKLSNRFGVTSHIRKHFNDKPYVCIHCKCTFDSANACVTHLDQYHKLGKLPPMYDPAVHVLAGVPSSPPSSVGKTETFSSETHQVSGIAEEKMQLEPQWPIHFAAKRDIDFTFTMSVFEKAALRKFFHAGVYLCDTCSFKCATRIDVTAHVRRHNKEKPYQCLHCSAGFDSAMPMMAHCDMHQKEDSSQTEVEENTSTPQQSPMPEATINESSDQDEDKKSAVMNSLGLYGMDSIKQEVKNTEVYQFPVRGKDYTVKESVYLLKLRAHLSTLSKFACEFCHTESPTVDEAIDHMALTHALPGGFRREFHCVMCTEKFSDEKFMRNHIVVHHTRSANMAEKLVISKSTTRQTGEEYLCLVCGKVTKTEWDSELHKRQCPGAQNEFFCTMCSFKSPSLGAMSTHCHMKHTTHLQLERDPFTGNYICTFCSLVWPQADEDAKAHSCKMNGIGTWYVCKDCNFTSVEKSVVLLHKLFYHSDRAEEFVLPGQLVNIAASKTETGSQKYEIGTADPSSDTTNQVASPVEMQASPTSSMASPAGVQVSPSTQMVSPHAQEYQHQAVLSQMAYVKAAKNFVEHSQANIKPPKAPAKPITAYIRYSKDKYKEVKSKYPDLGVGSIGRIIGAQWHALTAEEKSKYTEEYMKDKERYQQEMMKYHESAEYKAYAKARASAKQLEKDRQKLKNMAPTTSAEYPLRVPQPAWLGFQGYNNPSLPTNQTSSSSGMQSPALSVLPHPLTKNLLSSPPTPPSQTSDQDVMLISPGHPSTDIPDRIMEKSYRCNKCGCRFKLQSEHKYHMTHYHSTQTDMKWEEQLQQMASPQSRESFQDQRRQMIAAQSYPAPSYSTNNMMAQPPSSFSQQPMPVPTGIFTSQFYEEQLASSADSAETDDNDVLEDMTSTTGSTMDERLDSATPITSSTSLQMPVIANVISLSE
ncbi:uncharacterized protein [Amphiura filiformis]|uniref:uncharacterized protein isoform X2 n=1 Tax=Amphiura filiformis TaxID=82378 RepID=UPI003B215D2E